MRIKLNQRQMFMIALILAGEAVFALPFHVARFFRPTLLEVFDITATELGAAQGIYGVVAMLMYFPGGALADRFPARKLLAFSLWSTSMGGLYMTSFPGYLDSALLWGFFGVTTILFFWAALISATREWGGTDKQGKAFGLLDGGRGLLAATLASLGVALFAYMFPDDYAMATLDQKAEALRSVIYGYALATALAGVLVWFAIPEVRNSVNGVNREFPTLAHLTKVFRFKAVWMQAIIILCAYVGYKGFDNYSLFAVQAYGMNEVDAAGLVALGAWLRPVTALAAGLLGDRFNVLKMLFICFILLLVADLFFALTTPIAGAVWILAGNVLITCIAIFGLRALYFALFEEIRMPVAMTGTAVGIVSVLGFTPDIFVTLVAGLLIDANPGVTGHQHFFMFLSAFAALGVATSYLLMKHSAADQK